MNKAESRPFNVRAMIVFAMIVSFVCLPPAGVALHFASAASFQPTRHLLMTIHDITATIFLFSVLLHVKLNWRPLWNYVKTAAGKVGSYRQELAVAGLGVAVPLALGILHVFVLGS